MTTEAGDGTDDTPDSSAPDADAAGTDDDRAKKEQRTPWWQQRFPFAEQFAVVWCPKELAELEKAMTKMVINTVADYAVRWGCVLPGAWPGVTSLAHAGG